jgi:hypothetical protein
MDVRKLATPVLPDRDVIRWNCEDGTPEKGRSTYGQRANGYIKFVRPPLITGLRDGF